MLNSTKGTEHSKTLIFLHLPKTAGSTLHKIIERQYKSKSIYSIDNFRTQESAAEFKSLPEAQRSEIQVLKGHMRFGLHEYLPQPSSYITILREPVDRVISHYYYVLRKPNHYLYEQVTSKNMTLKDYVSSGITRELDNSQTRLLSSIAADIPFGKCSPDVLESAKKNLEEHFAVIGLADKFDETLILLKRAFNWKTPFYIKANITKNRPLKEDISQETLEVIKKYNELDTELFNYAKQKFEEQINQLGKSFEMEMAQLNLLNRIYTKTHPIYCRILNKTKID